MIEQLLKESFPVLYGLNPDKVSVPIQIKDIPFVLSDPKTCFDCQTNPSRADRIYCNREILKVNNNDTSINVVWFEDYIQQFKNTRANVKDRCDVILTDNGVNHTKIVFCDLCCYEEKYVEPNDGNSYPQGKRAKARQQMEKSIEVLIQESVTAVNLLTYPEKVCLFAWRDYSVPNTPVRAERGNPLSNMQAMITSPSSMATHTTTHHQQLGYGFTFMQIKYPAVYSF